MKFAKYVFNFAGILGLILLIPQYFLESKIGQDFPPAITHPKHFYGFIGVAVAFQIVFLIIASDPKRFRPLMLASVIEKFSFGVAMIALYLSSRIPAVMVGFGLMDMTLGILFVVSYLKTADGD